MAKASKRRHPETFYQKIVQRYVAKRFNCVAVRELNFGGPRFDVVGFSPDTEEFHIVECKRTGRPVDVGKTFGQILAYQAMIYDAGENFLDAFARKLTKDGVVRVPFWKYGARFVDTRMIPVRFYVALRDKACRQPEMLRLIKKNLDQVGIIRIDPYNHCKDYVRVEGKKDFALCRATTVEVPLSVPTRKELKEVLDHKGSSQQVALLAVKLDARILRMKKGLRSVRHGKGKIVYREARNFAALLPRKKHLRVDIKQPREWQKRNIKTDGQLRRVLPRIKRALERAC